MGLKRQLGFAILTIAGCATAGTQSDGIEPTRPDSSIGADSHESNAVHYSLDGFETSEFCAVMGCRLKAQWNVRTGTNTLYDLDSAPSSSSAEVTTLAGEVFEGSVFGFTGIPKESSDFHKIARLYVEYFVRAPCQDAIKLIDESSTQDLSRIEDAPSISCHGWQIRTGRVMMNSIVWVRRQP